MKKINFKKLQVPAGLAGLRNNKFSVIDIATSLADDLYMSAMGIAQKRLAEKIYDSKGEIELNEDEQMILKAYISSSQTIFVFIKDAIELALKN